jgi:hypothetical protein
MKPWEANANLDEPTHDPEIHQWFQGLGPPAVQQAPTYLQAKVRARILNQQRRAGIGAWMGQFARPMWATALATLFVLSLGANIWWGLAGRLEGPRMEGPRVADASSRALTVYPFQAQFSQNEALQAAVAARAAIEPEGIGRGFVSGYDRRVAFFRMGTAYADALAALHSQVPDAASAHLHRLIDTLRDIQAPAILASYLQEIATWRQSSSYTDDERTQLLALFEPLYVTAYNRQDDPRAVSLFQIAAWLENMALVASTREPMGVEQPAVLQGYHEALTRLQAPSKAIEAFGQIRALASQAELSQAERLEIRRLVQTMQQLLGAMAG